MIITCTHSSIQQVVYSRPAWYTDVIPIGGTHMNGNLISIIQNVHFPVGTMDIFGAYNMPTGTPVEYKYVGWKPREPRRNLNRYIRFNRLVNDARILLSGDLSNFISSRRSIEHENDVLSTQPVGKGTIYSDGARRYYEDHYADVTPTTFSKFKRAIGFRWDQPKDTELTMNIVTSHSPIQVGSIDGLPVEKLTNSAMKDGLHDWFVNSNGVWLYFIKWDKLGVSFTFGVATGNVLAGVKTLSVHSMYIDLSILKTAMPLYIGQDYLLSDFFHISGDVYTKQHGVVLRKEDGNLPTTFTRTSVETALEMHKYLHPELALDGDLLEEKITFSNPFFERPVSTPLANASLDIADLENYLGYDRSTVNWYRNTNGAGFINTAERNKFYLSSTLGRLSVESNLAIESVLEPMSNNYLETLGELKEVLDPIITTAALIKYMKNPHKFGGFDIVTFLKLLASTNLGFWFGVAPNVKAAGEISAQLRPSLTRLIELANKPIKAKSTTVFTDVDCGGTKTKVVSSSKVMMKYEISPVVFFMLTVDNIGLLPRLSRVFETWPLSFVIDSYVGISDKIARLENHFRNAFFTIDYSVSSLNFIYEFQNIDLETMHVEQDSATDWNDTKSSYSRNKLGISTYCRLVFADGVPVPGPDILGRQYNGLNFHIAASMLTVFL